MVYIAYTTVLGITFYLNYFNIKNHITTLQYRVIKNHITTLQYRVSYIILHLGHFVIYIRVSLRKNVLFRNRKVGQRN